MSQPTQSNAGIAVVDANIFISVCSKEPTEATARTALADYAVRNWAFYAPNVIFAEVLFALCRRLTEGTLDAASHKRAVEDFRLSYLPRLLLPPQIIDVFIPLAASAARAQQPPAERVDPEWLKPLLPKRIVYSVPGMERIKARKDVVWKRVDGVELKLDLYAPPGKPREIIRRTIEFIRGRN